MDLLRDSKMPVDASNRLAKLEEKGKRLLCPADISRVSFGTSTCGKAAGAAVLRDRLAARVDLQGIATVVDVGCFGACFAEPLVDVRTTNGLHYFFGNVDPTAFWHVIRAARGASPSRYVWAVAAERQRGVLRNVDDLALLEVRNTSFGRFLEPQNRRITGRCGLIDPSSLAEFVATGGYAALGRAILEMQPAEIITIIAAAGLRGRGGGGFPTAHKWKIAASQPDPVRVVIANADEGDPGAYMDRALLESDPHGVLEGLIITSYAVGARRAYIFVRHEYPLAVQCLRTAVSLAYQEGLLGDCILGSNFSLDVKIIESGGAFVCGEETAMLQVMSGERGEPRRRPPYPATSGLNGHPTVINNVETLANVPWILLNGPDAFCEVGTEKSPGTKIFCLTGDIKRTGFIEVPFGMPASMLIETIGGTSLASVKGLQIGGPSGGILPADNVVLDYESVVSSGAMVGSGGLVVLSVDQCLVDLARHLIEFMADESCGKCVMCRDGLAELANMLSFLVSGKAYDGILDDIENLSRLIATTAQCGLGKSAVNPALSTLRYFRSEYEAHTHSRCPALSCSAFITFAVDPSACSDCRCCFLTCPVDAVKPGAGKKRHFIDPALCINCWACYELCPNGCIKRIPKVFHE